MAEGIRIRHITGTGPAVIAIKDLSEPFDATNGRWPACSICGIPEMAEGIPMGHQGFKTRHVTVDADGYAIVSAGVWEGISKFVDNGGFELVNTVPAPPAVTMSFKNGRDPHITVHHKVPREIRSRHGDGGNQQLP